MLKVFVAISGGVDSSMVVALLKERGDFDVEAIYFKMFESDEYKYAKEITAKLGVKFHLVDARKEFEEKVINYFKSEYEAGKTPNPCVVCNQEIKFGLLLGKALELGADFLATGHYARLAREFKMQNSKCEIKEEDLFRLFRAKDEKKDQTYFLYRLTQEKLRHLIFPLGDYLKSEVKTMAKERNLLHKEGESNDICFLQGEDIRSFLSEKIKFEKGLIKTLDGKIIGEHAGLPFYTIGQRSGIGIGGTGPYYVCKIDVENNILWVSGAQKEMMSAELFAGDLNWLSGIAPEFPFKCLAKIRYNHEVAEVEVFETEKDVKVVFEKPQWAITPGQSVVFYKEEELLGGGIIKEKVEKK